MNETQRDFLHLVKPAADMVEVCVSEMGDHFMATIGDWWMATGSTAKAAVKAVVKMYSKECRGINEMMEAK